MVSNLFAPSWEKFLFVHIERIFDQNRENSFVWGKLNNCNCSIPCIEANASVLSGTFIINQKLDLELESSMFPFELVASLSMPVSFLMNGNNQHLLASSLSLFDQQVPRSLHPSFNDTWCWKNITFQDWCKFILGPVFKKLIDQLVHFKCYFASWLLLFCQ